MAAALEIFQCPAWLPTQRGKRIIMGDEHGFYVKKKTDVDLEFEEFGLPVMDSELKLLCSHVGCRI